MPEELRFKITITATAVVRDTEGNIVSQNPIEATEILTEDQLRERIEKQEQS